MIALTRLNGHPVMVNSDLIEQIEETPDTVVTLTSGNRLIVRDRMLVNMTPERSPPAASSTQ